MTDKLKTASAHNKDLTGRVETVSNETVKYFAKNSAWSDEDILRVFANEILLLRDSLSRAQERLKEVDEAADAVIDFHAWLLLGDGVKHIKDIPNEEYIPFAAAVDKLSGIHHLATDTEKENKS